MTRLAPRLVAATFTIFALASLIAGQALAAGGNWAAVRAATARFHSTHQAERAGYGPFPPGAPLHECISNLTGPGA
jgi:Mn2+/Fe2+ NRAMP family transporter